MIGNIKKTFPPKTGMWKKQVLQYPGYVRGVKGPCCMLHGILQGCTNIIYYYFEGVKRNKIIINQYIRLYLRSLFVMLEALYTYMNRMKPLATVCTHSGFITI